MGVLALLVAAPGASAAGTGVIIYTCAPNLCRINPNGTGQQQLTFDGVTDGASYAGPSISRDGTKLIFIHGAGQLYLSNAAVQHPTVVAHLAEVGYMRPDGLKIVDLENFSSVGATGVCEFNLDGGGRLCPASADTAGWAPDGNPLIAANENGELPNTAICEIDSGGNCVHIAAHDPSSDLLYPAVSPDGTQLAVTAIPQNAPAGQVAGSIALYDYRTGQFERDLTSASTDDEPAWSPDGSQLAFERGSSIYEIAASGPPGSERLLVAGGQTPTWGAAPTIPSRPATIHLSAPRSDKRAALLAHGLSIKVQVNQRSAVAVLLILAKTTARKLGLGSKQTTIGTTTGIDNGSHTFLVKIKSKYRSKLSHAKNFRLIIGIVAQNAERQTTQKLAVVSITH